MAAAYHHCEEVTRQQARNFYYGIRLLPPRKRDALCAVYAFARRIDDLGDGDLPLPRKLEALARARDDLMRLDTRPNDPVLVALADAAQRHHIALDAFGDLIDGVTMDLHGARYATFDELVVYCRRVAGSVGRLSVAVFGANHPAAPALADDLGVAMQLTNILRDVREDLASGRIYLPGADLTRFAVDLAFPASDRFARLVRFEAARARRWFGHGLTLLAHLDRRSAACVAAMTGVYRRLLGRLERDPTAILQGRIAVPAWEKAYVAARCLAGAVP